MLPGRQSVVDDDDGVALERDHRRVGPEPGGAAFELDALARFDVLQRALGDAEMPDHVRVEDADAVFADRAHPELGL